MNTVTLEDFLMQTSKKHWSRFSLRRGLTKSIMTTSQTIRSPELELKPVQEAEKIVKKGLC